jgi:hypothetical protein
LSFSSPKGLYLIVYPRYYCIAQDGKEEKAYETGLNGRLKRRFCGLSLIWD